MKKTLTTLAIAVTGVFSNIVAQQDPQFTQFMYCRQAYNPAYAGTSGAICFDGLYRQQWTNFPGAPKTGLFSFNMNAVPAIGLGAGLTVMNDKLGFDNTTMARLAVDKMFPIGETGALLSVGLDAGILQKRIDGNWVAPQTLNDPAIPSNTNTQLGGTGAPVLNKTTPDFGAGLYFTIPNKMYVGISTSHIGAQELKGAKNPSTSTNAGWNLTFNMARHYYLIGGYTFSFDGGDHNITPNIKVKTDARATQLDLNVTYMYKRMMWLGASYRMQDAIAPMLGYQAPFGLKVGYSYDVTLSKIKGYSSGTHEIMLGYCFKPKNVERIQSHGNVRFLED